MLTPHHRKDPQLGEVWLAAENFLDLLEFFRGETMFRHQLRSNNRIGGRFGADHRQRTLTNVAHGSTRERSPQDEDVRLAKAFGVKAEFSQKSRIRAARWLSNL